MSQCRKRPGVGTHNLPCQDCAPKTWSPSTFQPSLRPWHWVQKLMHHGIIYMRGSIRKIKLSGFLVRKRKCPSASLTICIVVGERNATWHNGSWQPRRSHRIEQRRTDDTLFKAKVTVWNNYKMLPEHNN